MTPDIILSGEMVDRLHALLNNATVLAKGADGLMHPFVDPNPIINILREAVKTALKERVGMDAATEQRLPV